MLVPAAVAGLIIFLSGFSLFNASQIRSGWGRGRGERGGPGGGGCRGRASSSSCALLAVQCQPDQVGWGKGGRARCGGPGRAAPSPVVAPRSARRSVRPTTSFCARAATIAVGTSSSRTPAPLPRFAAPLLPAACLPGGGEAEGLPCRAGLTLPRWGHGGQRKAAPSPVHPSPQLTHLFDNEGTVLFAIFMALWGESPWALGGSLSSGATPAPCTRGSRPSPRSPRNTWCRFFALVCSHGVPGDLEAAAGPRGPALGPVRVGRGPGEAAGDPGAVCCTLRGSTPASARPRRCPGV